MNRFRVTLGDMVTPSRIFVCPTREARHLKCDPNEDPVARVIQIESHLNSDAFSEAFSDAFSDDGDGFNEAFCEGDIVACKVSKKNAKAFSNFATNLVSKYWPTISFLYTLT